MNHECIDISTYWILTHNKRTISFLWQGRRGKDNTVRYARIRQLIHQYKQRSKEYEGKNVMYVH